MNLGNMDLIEDALVDPLASEDDDSITSSATGKVVQLADQLANNERFMQAFLEKVSKVITYFVLCRFLR